MLSLEMEIMNPFYSHEDHGNSTNSSNSHDSASKEADISIEEIGLKSPKAADYSFEMDRKFST
ncbi:hypothetical protein Ciccas_002770 [Cichlidogyrus casuarinus]|uniref:Uncharacterized protein n=1 Tax=Cichlidogyrus casuarinus TaxID=1844966 RepID=A0ABD2QGW2_9PLAT